MKSFPRAIIASLFLSATLVQIFLPVSAAQAGIDVVPGAVQCAGAGIPEPKIQEGPTVPVTDTAVFQMLSRIKATTGGTCTNVTKESFIQHVLNVLAYAAINVILQTITNQIIGWIKGSDSNFVQNLQAEALRTADAEAGGLLVDLTGVNLCGNIGEFLKLSIGAPTASLRQRMQCSVTGIVGNFQNFYDNFANGGWPAFFQISLEPQNNAYGAFLLALNEQTQRQTGAQQNLLVKLAQGSGFKGFEVSRSANCRTVNAEQSSEVRSFMEIQQRTGGKPSRSISEIPNDPDAEPQYEVCDLEYDTKTPGKLFADALPAATFSGLRRAELANTIDQAIGQIVFALLQRIIQESTGSGGGLFGSSSIATPGPTTLTQAGFRPTYLTNQTDDSSLRLEASELLLDVKIQDLDIKIAAINTQITPLETACAAPNPGDTCNQAQITSLNAEKTRITAERATALSLLTHAHRDLIQILDLRTQILGATNATVLENLATQLSNIQSDVEDVVQQAGGPAVGGRGPDIDENFVKITSNAQNRATAIGAYLEKRIAEETEPVKKAALAKARDDLKKLADNLGRLRTDFLTAIANEAPTAGIMIQITDQIGEINDKILSVYSL